MWSMFALSDVMEEDKKKRLKRFFNKDFFQSYHVMFAPLDAKMKPDTHKINSYKLSSAQS